jgi:hypothetical protein
MDTLRCAPWSLAIITFGGALFLAACGIQAAAGTRSICGFTAAVRDQTVLVTCHSDCLPTQGGADIQCEQRCMSEHTVISRRESCALPPPPAPPAPPPKPTATPANCVGGPAPPDAIAGSKQPLDHRNGPSLNVWYSCLRVPAGQSISRTWCKLSDDWGHAWCQWGKDCQYWGNAAAPPNPDWYLFGDTPRGPVHWEYCITGINDSSDRNRIWQIFGK